MTRTAASTTAERPADVLRRIANVRLAGERPTLPVMVTTERHWTELYAARRHPVIEVWRRDLGALDWRPIGGLRVEACVSWTSYDERLELFESLREAQPAELHWYAINPRGTGPSSHWMGCMWLKAGVPIEWHTPFDQMLEESADRYNRIIDPPLKVGEQLVSYGRV
jgi:hypothetical protein